MGSAAWFRASPGDLPLYFDRGTKKTGKCAARYALYSPSTTLGEYLRLNPPEHQSKDFKYDFAHGHLRLPPSGALLSLNLGELRSVNSVFGPLPEFPEKMADIARAYAVRIVDLGESIPSLSSFALPSAPLIGIEEPWSPSANDPEPLPASISPDALDERARTLARFDTSMAPPALALEALDSGANSPPQVGGGPIDVLTAFGLSIHRQLSFYSEGPSAGLDRDLTPAPPPCDEFVAAFSPRDDPDEFDDGCLFLSGADAGSPPLGFRLPGARVFGIGATELRSIAALRRSDWNLWEPAVRKEVDHAFTVKKALQYRTNA